MTLRPRRRRRGAATVELAVLLPFLMYLAVLATDWARLLHYTLTLNACARNGALYASDAVIARKSQYANLQAAAMAEAPSLTGTATVTGTPYTETDGFPGVEVNVSMPFKTITNFPGVPASQTISRKVRMRIAPLSTN